MKRNRYLIFLHILVVLFLCPLLTFRIIVIFRAELDSFSAHSLYEKGEALKALPLSVSAVNYNPTEPTHLIERARILALLGAYDCSYGLDNLHKRYAARDLVKAVEMNSHNILVSRRALPIYYTLSAITCDPGTDPFYVQKTRDHIWMLKHNYPNDAGVLVQAAHYENLLGLDEDYRSTKNLIQQLRSDLLEWHPSLR